MADKLDNVYKNINDPQVKNRWIRILQENPTNAIDAYHKALCKENETNGWCGLMNLFRILGALEEIKNQRDNPQNKQLLENINNNVSLAVPEEVKKLQTEHEKLKKEKEERDNKEKKDLEKLKIAIDNLKNNIHNGMGSIQTEQNDILKEAIEQLEQLEQLKQINTLKT
jgi:hypothetical protein